MKKAILVLMLAALSSAPLLSSAAALDSLTRFFQEVRSVNARFEQVVLDEDGRAAQQSAGRMWIARPDKFRWEYLAPYEQQIVGDGKKVWVYDRGLEQVVVRSMAQALGETPAVLLAGGGPLQARFHLKDLGQRDGLEWAQLTPKNKEGGFDQIRLGFAKNSLRILELLDSFGQTTRITLSDYQENRPIDPAMFRFTPPQGVDVLEQ